MAEEEKQASDAAVVDSTISKVLRVNLDYGNKSTGLTPVMLVQLSKLHLTQIVAGADLAGQESSAPPPALKWTVNVDSSRIYVSEGEGDTWRFIFVSDPTKLKIESAKIHVPSRCVILSDRKGDIYSLKFGKVDDKDTETVGELKRIMSHTSNIHCFVISQGRTDDLLFSADRDNKIRCALLSSPYNFQFYLLGHLKPVQEMVLLDSDQRLMSISQDGELKIWNLETRVCEETFNVFEKVICSQSCDVKGMSTSDPDNNGHLRCVVILSNKETVSPVFELSLDRKSLQLVRTVPSGTVWWNGQKLFVHTKSLENVSPLSDSSSANDFLKDVISVDFEAEENSDSHLLNAKRAKMDV